MSVVAAREKQAMPSPRRRERKAYRQIDSVRLTMWRVIVVLGFLLGWELLARTGIIDPFWISMPSKILPGLFEFLGTREGWEAIGVTLYEAMVGLILAIVFGVLTGYLVTRSKNVLLVVNPFIGVFNAVPRLALIPLFIVWFGIGSNSKIGMVFVFIYFIILVNTISGIESADKDHLVLARMLGATRHQVLTKIIIPSTIPWLLAAVRLGLGSAFGGAVVAEMIAGQGGLGFHMTVAAGLLNLRDLFISITIVMVIAYTADVLLLKLERRILRWRPSTENLM